MNGPRRRDADAEKVATHWLQEWRDFPNHSTRSFGRCALWSLWPDPGADTENPFHTELDRFPRRRAACGVQVRLRQAPCPNKSGGTFITAARQSLRFGAISRVHAGRAQRDHSNVDASVIHERDARFFGPAERCKSSDGSMRVLRRLPEKVGHNVVMGVDRQRPICISGHTIPVLAENQLGCAARNHMSRRICRTGNDPRHDGCVGHAQARQTMHTKLWIDDREIIHAHFARANGMSEARRAKPGKFPDLLGGRLWAGHDFDLAHAVKGTLISKHRSVFVDGHGES